jgi:hypothetical protein
MVPVSGPGARGVRKGRGCNRSATLRLVRGPLRDLALYLRSRGPLAQLGERLPYTDYLSDEPSLKTQQTNRR